MSPHVEVARAFWDAFSRQDWRAAKQHVHRAFVAEWPFEQGARLAQRD